MTIKLFDTYTAHSNAKSLEQIVGKERTESDYKTTNRNMRDPGYNCATSNNVLITKYYLENDFNYLIKRNYSYAKAETTDNLNYYFLSLDIAILDLDVVQRWVTAPTTDVLLLHVLTYFNSLFALMFQKCVYEGTVIILDVYILLENGYWCQTF